MQDVSYFLCCTQKRNICVTPSLIVFQHPAGFPRSWEHAMIGWHTVCIVWHNADSGCYRIWSDNVCGDLCNQGFPAKTNQNMCHRVQTVRNLVRGAENLTCTRKLFLYNFLCMTHHIVFVNSVWENYKSGMEFAPGRHFGESQPKKLKSLFSRNKQRSKKI